MLLIIFISYLVVWMMYIKSPLLGSLMLILISIFVSLFVSVLSSKWMTYLIILLFLGGMMVLFVYVCTLISSVKTVVKGFFSTMNIGFILLIFLSNFLYFNLWDLKLEMKNVLLSIMYSNSNFMLMIMSIIYLLMVLVISIKISQKFKGGLKSKVYEI